MRFQLLCAAAAAAAVIPAAPASAQVAIPSAAFMSLPRIDGSVRVHRDGDRMRHRHGQWQDGDRRDRRRGRYYGFDHYGGDWARYNNRSWVSDSFNDWWHDRPDRSSPRWVQDRQGCERPYWSGGGWTC